MKAYSVALRDKIAEADLQQEGSLRYLAKRFNGSARLVGELVNRFRRTGRYAPPAHAGGNPPRIDTSQYANVAALVKQSPDATLTARCAHIEATGDSGPSKSSLQRTLDQLKRTRKTRASRQQSVTRQRAKPTDMRIKKP